MQPILYVAITNHGFGHVTRAAAIVATIQKFCPEVLPILVTTAPRWLLECFITGDFIQRPRPLDVGVVQVDSVVMDKPATLEKLKQIREQERSIIAGEVSFIRQNRVGLILADIPPLAAKIGKAAGVPCWMMSNFGWDFIYRAWGGEFIELADWIGDCFSQCDRLFRMPFHEAMGAFPVIEDVGLTGGVPSYPLEQLRAELQGRAGWIDAPKEKTVLLTFGGLGLNQVPYEGLQAFPDWQFITFDPAPDLPNLLKVTERHLRPMDFMRLCRCIVSKPGYSTFSEACRLGLPILTITRDDFAETPLLLNGIQDYSHHRILAPKEFTSGTWEFLTQPLMPPRKAESLPTDGNETIAQAVADYFKA